MKIFTQEAKLYCQADIEKGNSASFVECIKRNFWDLSEFKENTKSKLDSLVARPNI